jgi:ribosomal protein S18 acetylase RimI-like enzyme
VAQKVDELNPPRTIIYKGTDFDMSGFSAMQDSRFRYVFWKPSLQRIVPPGKNKKYFFYLLFHYLAIFRNTDYSAVLVYDGEKLVSSLLVVPAHYKWPFMSRLDVQFTYILTHPDYRGMGLAEKAIRFAIGKAGNKGRCFWYVTDSENNTSIRLCTRIGFKFYSYAERTSILRILKADQVE